MIHSSAFLVRIAGRLLGINIARVTASALEILSSTHSAYVSFSFITYLPILIGYIAGRYIPTYGGFVTFFP